MAAINWFVLLTVLGSSAGVCALLVLTQRWHGRLSLDHDLNGVQKLHAIPVPRVGGLGLLFGLMVGVAAGYWSGGSTYPTTLLMLICAAPVFVAGLVEDLTKKVSVNTRLMASFVSAALGVWLLDARLVDVDTPILDVLVSYPAISVLFTVFAVGGVTHSVNIIDGLNGLAAGVVSIMLAGLAAMAWMHGDVMVMKLCLWGIAAMVGFLLLNYPFGRIFLGDGGAYLAGFWVAECGVLLMVRNPEVSTWAVLLACIYPVWETAFSMYRRRMVDRVQTGQPDMAHLHQLMFNRLKFSSLQQRAPTWLNHGLTSACIWGMAAACQVVAVLADNNSGVLLCGVLAYCVVYNWIYQALTPDTIESVEEDVQTINV